MARNSNILYITIVVACMAGYGWLWFSSATAATASGPVEVCLVKHTTGVPCPSCGTTRSVSSILEGQFGAAFQTNPLGYIVLMIMIITPLWVAVDFVAGKETLFKCYKLMEAYLGKPKIAIPLAALVVINWVWNMTKFL